ncbi:MAG: V-type ATP synthase subunit D [Chitinivibrionales bacterium]|nr:V-type ATP synthase subunit D [Chitinivibrionales bacterium]
MALKIQYNKIALQRFQKELKVRENALPTLQAKEAALRVEVKKAKYEVDRVRKQLDELQHDISATHRLWAEFPSGLAKVKDVMIDIKKIAGVKTPIFRHAEFEIEPFSLFAMPSWIPRGIELLKQIVSLRIEEEVARKKVDILEYARKKTTQKVNLYEKVQIPAFNEAILKIKRFLEDEENLAKSSQKILKNKIAAAEAA